MQDGVQQSASDVAREARALAQSLKEAVKKNESLDKDVEFKRKSLRKQHLKLLLLHPTSKEAKDAETHIWMQTSYQFISVYKQRLVGLDRKLFSPAAGSNKPTARQGPGEGGHVEYRKTLARFRQFLAEEERFYVQLLIRYESQFGLTEARAALVKAEILSPDQEGLSAAESGRSLFPEQTDSLPQTGDEREARLATFTKLLVCLGDIARYREQYNDGGGRPRAGHEEGPPRKIGRGGKRITHEPLARPRNYTRARDIYEQARLLLPNDGNASHQLAILSSYQKDSFGSLLNYYRALCVRQPYDTASDNLNTVLKKSLDQYRASKGNTADDPHAVQKVRVDRFLELVVVLHGLWYFDSDEHATRASKHSRHVVARFKSLVAEPALPANIISEILILAFSALWKIRMIRDNKIRANRSIIEPVIATHTLYLLRALLDVSRVQLAVKIEDVQDEEDLAQKITRVFRRVLPAMRVMSKWLRTNINYLAASANSASSPEFLKTAIKAFWDAYTAFLTPLNETFPLSKLPVLKAPLDEDVDLAGFSPIKKAMFVIPPPTENGGVARQEEVHPNEEYLMRISDLLKDVEQVAAIEKSPISFNDSKFTTAAQRPGSTGPACFPSPDNVETSLTPPPAPGPANLVGQESDDEDDDGNTEQTSRTGTEDDVVREAFKEALRDDVRTDTEFDDEEDERIVWSPPRHHLSPLQKIIQPPHMSPQIFPSTQSPVTATASPTRPLPPSVHSSGTTAQDLLNNVLGFSRSKSEQTTFGNQPGGGVAASSTPQASLLFGSGSFNSPTKSIWSSTGMSGTLGATGHAPAATSAVPQYGPGSLTPGHERARSQSFSFSQLAPTQPLTNTQDSIYGSMGKVPGALPAGHLGGNYGRLTGHHQSMSFSGSQSAFHNAPVHASVPGQTQVYYDSHLPQLPPAAPLASQIPDARSPQGYVGQHKTATAGPESFLYYDSRGTNAFPNMQSSASANQAIWGT